MIKSCARFSRNVCQVLIVSGACVLGAWAAEASSVTVEAESGVLGADWAVNSSGSPVFIAIGSNNTGGNPSSASRVATYEVVFPAAGTYELYARIRVGSAAFDDDSLFYGNGFGNKSPTSDGDWILVNGLASAGFTASGSTVAGVGSAGSQVWKWVNLSHFTNGVSESPLTFSVSADALARTFQIGAREDGLEIDKLVFGLAGYSFTVAELDAGGPGTPPPTPSVTIDPSRMHQTIEGFGGAIAFYNGWVRAHPYKNEIYTNAFAGLNLSMLRLANWFWYQGTVNFDPDAAEFVSRANQILGRPVKVMMSSWAPPAFLKSNGQVGNGGTLLYTNGAFAYDLFAEYWYDSLIAYEQIGVSPTWISIQNEPDWEASYDSCIFRPTEGFFNGVNWAGYPNALSAVYQRLASLPSPPLLLAPEVVHIRFNTLQNYAAGLNPNHFYGVAYHLYGDSVDDTIDGYIPSFRTSTNIFPNKPHFMTEYGVSNMIDSATLIHNALTEGRVSGYNYWSLIWPWDGLGLVQIEFPWDPSRWTNAPPGTPTQSRGYWLSPAYWSMKHYSYYVTPGSRRVDAVCTDPGVRVTAFITEDDLRLVAVLINRKTTPVTMDLNFSSFPYFNSAVFQTFGANHFQPLGPLGSQLALPAESLTTVVLDRFVAVGQASDPVPTNAASGVALSTSLGWTAGSNAIVHAVYFGASSNAVALATPASPEFRGLMTNAAFHPPGLAGNATYYWRVDEIAGANTNTGVVWSFTTAPAPRLVHRYSFNETGGTVVADSAGGPGWNGTLPNGGVFSAGQLTLASVSQRYVALPAGIVSGLTDFTIETWVRLSSTADWTRIFDFGSGTTVNMFLTPQNGVTDRVRFAITTGGAGGEQQINCNSVMSVGVWYHVAVTLSGSRGVLYLNGVPVGTNNAITLRPSNLGVTMNNYLGRSQYGADPYLNATFDEFRIYSVALSAAEIAATYALGPDQVLSDANPALSLAAAGGTLAFTWPLENAGFTLQSRTNLTEGDWVNVTSPVPQIVGGKWQVILPNPGDAPARFYRLVK